MNRTRLFVASCLALVATSMAFSIRADIIPALKMDFGLTDAQMGEAAGPGLWGFAITIVLGGYLVDLIGMGRVFAFAFIGHIAGVVLTIFAGGYWSLYTGTLLIGLANGCVEAVINPLVATLNPESKTKHLNRLHAWWPGGLVIGGLLGFGLTKLMGLDLSTASMATIALGWKIKMALILIPTVLYGVLLLGQQFPQTERVTSQVSFSEMLKESTRPLFLLFLFLMLLTAATELGPDQWVGNLLQNMVGIQGILLLIYTAGIMFVLRNYFAGGLLSAFGPVGLLTFASVLSCIGLYTLSFAETALAVFAAATVFGIGKTFFWPTMLGVVSERFPKGGALLLGLMGGAGMFSAGWLMAPVMGSIQDHYAISALSESTRVQVQSETGRGIDPKKVAVLSDPAQKEEVKAAESYSARMTYRMVSIIPAFLTLVFGMLTLYFRKAGGYQAVQLSNRRLVTT